MAATARIAAEQGSFNRIRQMATTSHHCLYVNLKVGWITNMIFCQLLNALPAPMSILSSP